jgi:hypothetical protein
LRTIAAMSLSRRLPYLRILSASALPGQQNGAPVKWAGAASRSSGMGIAHWLAEMIIREHVYRPITGTVLVIGRQTVNLRPADAIERMKKWGAQPTTSCLDDIGVDEQTSAGKGTGFIRDDEFFRLLGVNDFRCLDHSDYEGADLIYDLNEPLSAELNCIADFVIDGSTLDNIFNPALGLINLNKLLKPGGRLVSINMGSNWNNPYLIFTPMWFLDYFVQNKFADVKMYFVAIFEDGFNVVTPLLRFLHPSVQGIHNPRGAANMRVAGVVCLAEKGHDSTWDLAPSQHNYRSPASWAVFERNLRTVAECERPHLLWSNTEWRSHVPEAYEALLADQEAHFRSKLQLIAAR